MNDLGTLQLILSAAEAQLLALVTEKTAVLAALSALRIGDVPDLSSISLSASEGGESYSQPALIDRLATLTRLEGELTTAITAQKTICAQSGPGIVRASRG